LRAGLGHYGSNDRATQSGGEALRRQMDIGRAMPSGSGRAQRLDPLSLPVRFQASDGRADEQVRQIELHRERVVVRRTVRGMRMALNLPVSAFRGIALRMVPADERQPGALVLMLEHRDPAL